MQQILETLNNNQGAIMVILTGFVVLSSLLSWIWSRKQLNQIKNQWKRSQEPCIIVGIEGMETNVYFSVVNTGNEPAINAKFTLDPDFIKNLNEPEEKKQILRDFGNIGMNLIPNKTIHIPTYCIYNNIQHETLKLTVTYNSIHGDDYAQNLLFKLQMYGAVRQKNHFETEARNAVESNKNSLKRIGDYLKIISESMKTKE